MALVPKAFGISTRFLLWYAAALSRMLAPEKTGRSFLRFHGNTTAILEELENFTDNQDFGGYEQCTGNYSSIISGSCEDGFTLTPGGDCNGAITPKESQSPLPCHWLFSFRQSPQPRLIWLGWSRQCCWSRTRSETLGHGPTDLERSFLDFPDDLLTKDK